MKRVFLLILLTGAMVFALGASMQQLRADAAPICADYVCETIDECTHIGGGPTCKGCHLKGDHRCTANEPESE